MRTKPLLSTASAGTFFVLTPSTATALADPCTDPTGGAVERGSVLVSPSSAAPGSTVRNSGTCPTAADDGGDPVVQW